MPNGYWASRVKSVLYFVLAAFLEIAGCFSFWAWLRQGRPMWVLLPGIISLVLFSFCLTQIDSDYAGRAYAAYGGIYIVSSLVWLRVIEGSPPDRWDIIGASISIVGALIILLGPR